jgi:glucose 1-dehydrogenase
MMGREAMQLKDKVAIATGASSGIGRSIALAFAGEGAAVAVNYARNVEGAEAAIQEIADGGGRAVAVQADVSKPEDVKNLVGQTVQRFGRLDVMVNNAGVEHKMSFLDTPLDVWEEVLAVNLTGPRLGCQEAARQMVGQGGPGRIINLSSVHEDLAMPTNSPYCAAKGGLRMLTRTIAVELASHGITINNVAPVRSRPPWTPLWRRTPTRCRNSSLRYPSGGWDALRRWQPWPCIWRPTPPPT